MTSREQRRDMGVRAQTEQQQVEAGQFPVHTLLLSGGGELLAIIGSGFLGGTHFIRCRNGVNAVPFQIQLALCGVGGLDTVAFGIRTGYESFVRPPHVHAGPVDQGGIRVIGDRLDHLVSHTPTGEHQRGLAALVLGLLQHGDDPAGRLLGKFLLATVGDNARVVHEDTSSSIASSTASSSRALCSALVMTWP